MGSWSLSRIFNNANKRTRPLEEGSGARSNPESHEPNTDKPNEKSAEKKRRKSKTKQPVNLRDSSDERISRPAPQRSAHPRKSQEERKMEPKSRKSKSLVPSTLSSSDDESFVEANPRVSSMSQPFSSSSAPTAPSSTPKKNGKRKGSHSKQKNCLKNEEKSKRFPSSDDSGASVDVVGFTPEKDALRTVATSSPSLRSSTTTKESPRPTQSPVKSPAPYNAQKKAKVTKASDKLFDNSVLSSVNSLKNMNDNSYKLRTNASDSEKFNVKRTDCVLRKKTKDVTENSHNRSLECNSVNKDSDSDSCDLTENLNPDHFWVHIPVSLIKNLPPSSPQKIVPKNDVLSDFDIRTKNTKDYSKDTDLKEGGDEANKGRLLHQIYRVSKRNKSQSSQERDSETKKKEESKYEAEKRLVI